MSSKKESTKILKTITITTLLLILTLTIGLQLLASPDPSLTVTAKTDKKSYLLRQKVTIEGNITQDGLPASDLVVAVQVEDSRGMSTAFRTLTIGDPTQTWLINITNLSLMDMGNNPINTAKIDTQIQVGITIYNWQMTQREVYARVTVFDANMVPLQVGFWHGIIDPQQTRSPKFTIYIPEWACSGKALICGNVYNEEPKEGGMALSLEKAMYFCISKTQQGLLEYPSLPPPPPQTTPGIYNTYIRLPPEPAAGKYTLYIKAQTSPTKTSSTSTTFNVKNSWGYPPQASFAFWPAAPYENMTVEFDASSSTPEGFNDTIIKYEWDFGDGSPKIIREGDYANPPDPTVTHAYMESNQYVITLNVTDNEGLWSTTSKPITVYPEFGPTANFTWAPDEPIVNYTITFYAANSQQGWSKQLGDYSPIIKYNWNFSDGAIINATNPTITHIYTQPANYTVTLTVIDSVDRTNSTSEIIQVYNVTAKLYDVAPPGGDGKIDIMDVRMTAKHFGTREGDEDWDPIYDVFPPEGDGKVDIADVRAVAKHFGEDP